jgi:hypothetical protein
MSFWTLSTQAPASGAAEASHVANFTVIPDGTQAPAQIKEFVLIESSKDYAKPLYSVIFKIIQGDYKNREVRLKIKCFDDKTTVSDRGINLLKRIYDLCNYQPTHSNAPTEQDLVPMLGKVMGIKIAEFIGTNSKTGEPTNGNYVSEVWKADSAFETLTGTKLEVTTSHVDTAFSRNAVTGLPSDNSDIPF